jgi:hypothetical protein
MAIEILVSRENVSANNVHEDATPPRRRSFRIAETKRLRFPEYFRR